VSAKYVAVAWIVLLELIAAVYLYANPVAGQSQNQFFIQTSTTTTTTSTTKPTTTHPPSDSIKVESAVIANGTLMMDVHNLGPSTTKLLTVTEVCTPRFQTCYDYRKLSGSYYQITFVLPAERTFVANLSGVCTIAISGCKNYLPVANMTYYLQVKFTFVDGVSIVVPVSAMANDTWDQFPTAVLGISFPSLLIVPANLTGMLNYTIDVNDSLPYASWTTQLDGYMKPSNAFSGVILSNKTGCTSSSASPGQGYRLPKGAYNYTDDCSAGTFPILVGFSTVLTGITSTSYYSLVIRDTTDIDNATGHFPNCGSGPCSNFALWIQGSINGTSITTTTTTTTHSKTTTTHTKK
jgi:hypothetical protein